jgi:hypothetical protein
LCATARTATKSRSTPDWNALFEVAQGQAGYFTTGQAAAAAAYAPQLLAYLGNKKVARGVRQYSAEAKRKNLPGKPVPDGVDRAALLRLDLVCTT